MARTLVEKPETASIKIDTDYYDVLDKYQIENDEKPFIAYIKEKYFEG